MTEQASQAQSLQPHQQRVLEEKAQLDERIAKLSAFVETSVCRALDGSEQFDLHNQLNSMECYSAALGRRIARFTGAAS